MFKMRQGRLLRPTQGGIPLGAKPRDTSGRGAPRAIASRPRILLAILIALSVSLPAITLSVGGSHTSGWGTAELIETNSAGGTGEPQVAVSRMVSGELEPGETES